MIQNIKCILFQPKYNNTKILKIHSHFHGYTVTVTRVHPKHVVIYALSNDYVQLCQFADINSFLMIAYY